MSAATGSDPRGSSGNQSPDRASLPFSAALGLIVGLLIFLSSATELRDIDLLWHLLAGQQLASGVSPRSVGLEWSLAPGSTQWTSTQWLAEWLLFQIHALGGWAAVAAIRVVTAAFAVALLARATLKGRPAALAGLPFIVAATAITLASQARPQQATLIGACVLGGVLVDGLAGSRLPRWFVLLPLTVLWANLHGGWILSPAVLGLIAIGRAVDAGPRDPLARRALGLSALAVASGLLTPAGLDGLTAVLRFSRAAELIREWQPVQPTHGLGILTMMLVAMLAVGWAKSRSVPWGELIAGLALVVFTWTAWRNVAPGLALLAPLTAQRLVMTFPSVDRPEPRWSKPAGAAFALALTIAGLVAMVARDHLPYETQPIALAQEIGKLPSGQRVLNQYSAAGAVLYFGGSGTRVGIDGRSDRYGAAYIESYLELEDLEADWMSLLAELDPSVALIKEDSALAYYLTTDQNWAVLGSENDYTLLQAPAD